MNILIENNVSYNHHTHGISVGETDGLTIRNNTLLNDPHVRVIENIAPRINPPAVALNVTIEDNILEPMWNWEAQTSHPGWTVGNNLFVQPDPGENYYGDLFVSPFALRATLADLRAVAGGVIETLGLGAAMTRADITLVTGPVGTTPDTCEAQLASALAALTATEVLLAGVTAERDAAEAQLSAADAALNVALTDLAASEALLTEALAKIDAVRAIVGD